MIKEPKMLLREKYTEDDYDEMLDECCEEVSICGLTYSPSYVLKHVDPIAYRCGFSDYQEEEEYYVCPVCEEEHDNIEEARWCCQERPKCPVCGEEYECERDAMECCENEEDDEWASVFKKLSAQKQDL